MKCITSLVLLLIASVSMAQGVPNTFTAGTPALAAEVNANFTNLDTRVSTNTTNIAQVLASDGNNSIRVGSGALSVNTTGRRNTAIGTFALNQNTTGNNNIAVGNVALANNTLGFNNVAIGVAAGNTQTTGSNNIAIGNGAGLNLTTGNDNITIGHGGAAAEASTIRIGTLQARAFISGIYNATTGLNNALNVVVDSFGQLGTFSSSRRYKEQIHDMAAASERLLSLRPVTFRYKKAFAGGDKPMQFGLIAEEVAEVFPELVVYNEDGTPEAVKYRLLSTLLLNELQKQGAELRDMQARLVRLEIDRPAAVASIQ